MQVFIITYSNEILLLTHSENEQLQESYIHELRFNTEMDRFE